MAINGSPGGIDGIIGAGIALGVGMAELAELEQLAKLEQLE
jgi:hypothetical protein